MKSISLLASIISLFSKEGTVKCTDCAINEHCTPCNDVDGSYDSIIDGKENKTDKEEGNSEDYHDYYSLKMNNYVCLLAYMIQR